MIPYDNSPTTSRAEGLLKPFQWRVSITGDHSLTVGAIAEQIGLGQNGSSQVFSGEQLARMNNEELANAIKNSAILLRLGNAIIQ